MSCVMAQGQRGPGETLAASLEPPGARVGVGTWSAPGLGFGLLVVGCLCSHPVLVVPQSPGV